MTHTQTIFLQLLHEWGGTSVAFWICASKYAGITTDEAIDGTLMRIHATHTSSYGTQVTHKVLCNLPRHTN